MILFLAGIGCGGEAVHDADHSTSAHPPLDSHGNVEPGTDAHGEVHPATQATAAPPATPAEPHGTPAAASGITPPGTVPSPGSAADHPPIAEVVVPEVRPGAVPLGPPRPPVEPSGSGETLEVAPSIEATLPPGSALRNALFWVVVGFGMILVVGAAASSATRRRPNLRAEVFRVRFVLTVLLIGGTAVVAMGALQRGGFVVSGVSLATLVVLITSFGVWWLPRYLDGLWVVLLANQREAVIEADGVRGSLRDVGPVRATLVDAMGTTTSVPITSFGGATVRVAPARQVRLQVTLLTNDLELARLRATISPFRDPSEPVVVDRESRRLTVRCWDRRAADVVEAELLALV